MIILAIETSCDETSAAILDGDRVLAVRTWSQIREQSEWGGVVPNVARRAHELRLPVVVDAVLHRAKLGKLDRLDELSIDAIAVTIGPGLAPALEAGIAYARELALKYHKPLIPVSHLEGHIFSVFLRRRSGRPYLTNLPNLTNPTNFLSLLISGGHTELVLSSNIKHPASHISHKLLGATLDDAIGECLDKVGRELGLGYPAGPVIEQLAKQGDSTKLKLPIPLIKSSTEDLNFSFSGLKTAAIQSINHTHDIKSAGKRQIPSLSKSEIVNYCASLQFAATESLRIKLRRAMKETGIKTVILAGGVSANGYLRKYLRQEVKRQGGQLYVAPKKFTGDNAAMIGLAAQWVWNRGEAAITEEEINAIDRLPNLNFTPSHPYKNK